MECPRLKAMLWKNFRLKLYRPIYTICEIVVPLLFIGLFMGVIVIIVPSTKENRKEKEDLKRITITELTYLQGSSYVKKIMRRTRIILEEKLIADPSPGDTSRIKLRSFDNKTSFETYLLICKSPSCKYGVRFHGGRKLTKNATNIKVSLRTCMNNTLHLYKRTSHSVTGYMDVENNFLELQDALVRGIFRLANVTYPAHAISFKKFPSRKRNHNTIPSNEPLLACLIALVFGFHCYIFTVIMGEEKESLLKDLMRTSGLPFLVFWWSWFITFFVVLLFIALILVCVLLYVKPSYSLLGRTDPSLLLFYILLVICVIISFCFMMYTFFNTAFYSALFSLWVWFVGIFAYAVITENYEELSIITKIMSCLVPSLGIMLGFRVISGYSLTGEGMQWKYVAKHLDASDNVALVFIIIMLVFNILLYLSIAIANEIICPRTCWKPKCFRPGVVEEDVEADIHGFGSSEGSSMIDLNVGIDIINLTKVVRGEPLLNDVSVKLKKGEINVLMGHNSSGKSLLLQMVTGLRTPTSGTVRYGEYDIFNFKDRAKIWEDMGFCPEENVLFEELTVRDHFYLFCALKGLRGQFREDEIEKYMVALQLFYVPNVRVKYLARGQKRMLSIAVALCGDSRYVILDEPSRDLDPRVRRLLWCLLESEKVGRTIVLTTQSMEEAEYLSDNVIVMCNGEVSCKGNPSELKRKHGGGYRLVVGIDSGCDVDRLTTTMQKAIQSITLQETSPAKAVYILLNEDVWNFEDLLYRLQKEKTKLKIKSLQLSPLLMEKVMLSTGVPPERENGLDINSSNMEQWWEEMDAYKETEWPWGKLILLHLYAMWIKTFAYARRAWHITFLKLFMLSFLVLFMVLETLHPSIIPRTLDPELYGDVKVPIEKMSSSAEMEKYVNTYQKITKGFFVKGGTLSDYIKKQLEKDPLEVRRSYIFGASFKDSEVVVWYNGEAKHSVPVSFLMVQNAILKTHFQKTLTVVNDPLNQKTGSTKMTKLYCAMGATLIVCLTLALYVVFYVKERATGAKHLQYTSGLSVATYWFYNLLFDLICYHISVIFVVVFLSMMNYAHPDFNATLCSVTLALSLFGFCMLPFIYLCSFTTKRYAEAFILVARVCSFFIILPGMGFTNPHISHEVHKWALIIFPVSSLVDYFMAVFNTLESGEWSKFYSFEQGVGCRMIIFLLEGIIFFGIVLLIDYEVFTLCKPRRPRTVEEKYSELDDNVAENSNALHETSVNDLLSRYEVVLLDVCKNFSKHTAVDHLSFAVKEGECFGLLGQSGSGISATLKMIARDMKMSSGDIYIHGQSIDGWPMKRHGSLDFIGYCPDYDHFLPELTVFETLKVHALVRGIPLQDGRAPIDVYAEIMLLDEDLHKRMQKCSAGARRKVSAALSIFGNPSVILLANPTANMDLQASRRYWEYLNLCMKNGASIVLATNSMLECETLCKRLSVLSWGEMRCLGSVKYLKLRFSKRYTLVVKGKKMTLEDYPSYSSFSTGSSASQSLKSSTIVWLNSGFSFEKKCNLKHIKEFISKTFPGSELIEERACSVTYALITNMTMSKVLDLLEKAKKTVRFAKEKKGKEEFSPHIEDYTLEEATMEQVFLRVTKYSRDKKPLTERSEETLM